MHIHLKASNSGALPVDVCILLLIKISVNSFFEKVLFFFNPVTSNAVAGMFGIRQIPITLATGFGGNIYCYKLNNIVFFTALGFYSDHQVSFFERCAFNFPRAVATYYFTVQGRSSFLSMLLNINGNSMYIDYGCVEYFGVNVLNWFSSMYLAVE